MNDEMIRTWGLIAGYALLIIPLGILLWAKVPLVGKMLVGAVRMTVPLLLVGFYLQVVFDLNQDLDMAVIPGSRQQFTLAHVVNPAVADMAPPGSAFLDETHGASGTWPKIHGEVGTDFDHLIVGPGHRHVKEALWIEQWQVGRHKPVLHDLEADLGSLCTVLVATHSIEYQHDSRILGHDDRRPVLVVLPVAERRDFCVLNYHVGLSLKTLLAGVGRPA